MNKWDYEWVLDFDLVKEYGLKGWELVCTAWDERFKEMRYVMKREFQEKKEEEKEVPTAFAVVDEGVAPVSSGDLAAYIGTKVVRAAPCDEESFYLMTGRDVRSVTKGRAGYLVIYEDGYKSWSPREVFERCYRRVTHEERALIV